MHCGKEKNWFYVQNHIKFVERYCRFKYEQYIYYFIYILCDSHFSVNWISRMHLSDDGCVRFLLTNFDWKNIFRISSSVMKIFVHTQNADDSYSNQASTPSNSYRCCTSKLTKIQFFIHCMLVVTVYMCFSSHFCA